MSLRAQELISVFTKHQPLTSQPYCLLDVDAARDLVHSGMARWEDKCRAIRFLNADVVAKLRDESCTMGASVTFAAVAGSRYHQALVEGWRPKYRFSESAA